MRAASATPAAGSTSSRAGSPSSKSKRATQTLAGARSKPALKLWGKLPGHCATLRERRNNVGRAPCTCWLSCAQVLLSSGVSSFYRGFSHSTPSTCRGRCARYFALARKLRLSYTGKRGSWRARSFDATSFNTYFLRKQPSLLDLLCNAASCNHLVGAYPHSHFSKTQSKRLSFGKSEKIFLINFWCNLFVKKWEQKHGTWNLTLTKNELKLSPSHVFL